MKVSFILNGKPEKADERAGTTLFDYLRAQGLFSVKYGSDRGETGADSVLIDDKIYNSSLLLLYRLENKSVVTLEYFSSGTGIHPLQAAFINEGAIQCGYCTPGLILAAEALLKRVSAPSELEVRQALAGVYCRCTGYVKPIKAVMKYSGSEL
ncbi:MAG: 2Fe-2S iron-sulfur cluster-binding protein [Candidatus Neomarinimicrobiota bacterium]